MRFTVALFLALFLISVPAYAGDFFLTVCDGSFHDGRNGPHRTTSEVASDLHLYATSGKTNGEYMTALMQGAVFYCTTRERGLVRAALVRGLIDAKKPRVRYFTDFLVMEGPKRAVSLIDSELAKKDLPQNTRERLLTARARMAPDAKPKKNP